MTKNLISAVLMLMSSTVLAGGSITWGEITAIAFQNKDLMLYSDDWQNPNGCEIANAVILKHTDSNFDKAYSLILAAYMSGKKVVAWSDECLSFDGKTYNHIRGFKYLQVK
ncbi:hypothetical protein [Teredinibacter turnerae]|uniref:Lipoprotein n=1 Tax=Teredinibacter turnerae (strain ATCC 39867 / T7901) TaxID=377629 RepID=C5BJ40_TERTT|nr:hypothetical protein [Teredinibacter turnerae]ACR12119.1 hypothetical protein TERTU_4442 [Teredinibacter turnerae T7901]